MACTRSPCAGVTPQYVLSFPFCFERADETYYFAYSYPYTYSYLQVGAARPFPPPTRAQHACSAARESMCLVCPRVPLGGVASPPSARCVSQRYLHSLDIKQMPYYRRECLGRTVQDRRLDMVTISSPANLVRDAAVTAVRKARTPALPACSHSASRTLLPRFAQPLYPVRRRMNRPCAPDPCHLRRTPRRRRPLTARGARCS